MGEKLLILLGCCAFMLLLFSCKNEEKSSQNGTDIKGHLFIIGGGDRPEYMMKRYIELAGGGDSAKIIVIPFASEEAYETGVELVAQFKEYGCANTSFVFFKEGESDSDSTISMLHGATGIYFSGGDQSRLTKMLLGTKLIDKVKDIYKNGGVIGGTSAGAAVMSKIMLTGEELVNKENRAFPCIVKGNVGTAEGFGFIENAIIDQHFIARKRQNRLLTLVIENQLPGIGIDESTAIIVKPDNSFEVLGESGVMVFEPEFCIFPRTDKNGNLSADKIVTRLLLSGDTYKIPSSRQISNNQ